MLSDIRDWLLAPASRALDTAVMLEQLIARLRAAGVGVARMSLSVRTLHPEVFVDNYTWTPETGMVVVARPNSLLAGRPYQSSPVIEIHRGVDEIRVRLPSEAERYPLTRELAEAGMTDYVAFALAGGPHRSFVSFASDAEAGFEVSLDALRRDVIPALSLRIELASQRSATVRLLRTYLGPNAARRVLDGAFRRGEGERIDAVIWTCDLRGFTTLVDASAIEEVLPTLDRYFECVADPIAARGGEVLKFIGDAVLAIFVDAEGDVGRACPRRRRRRVRGPRGAQRQPDRGRPRGPGLRRRPARRRGHLRQHRRDRAPRLHGHRPGRQRGHPRRVAEQGPRRAPAADRELRGGLRAR